MDLDRFVCAIVQRLLSLLKRNASARYLWSSPYELVPQTNKPHLFIAIESDAGPFRAKIFGINANYRAVIRREGGEGEMYSGHCEVFGAETAEYFVKAVHRALPVRTGPGGQLRTVSFYVSGPPEVPPGYRSIYLRAVAD